MAKYSDELGTIIGGNHNEPRTARPQGLFESGGLTLKLYSMVTGNHPDQDRVNKRKEFIKEELEEGRLELFSGLGFAIFSRTMTDIAIWTDSPPLQLKAQRYELHPNYVLDHSQILCTRNVGNFYIWETGVVHHEKEAWERFINSKMGEEDKRTYLADFFSEDL